MASFVQYLGLPRSQSLRGRLFHWQVDDSSAKDDLLSEYTQNLEYVWELARGTEAVGDEILPTIWIDNRKNVKILGIHNIFDTGILFVITE